ncbi:hypothetical protein BGZ63DRAFT_71928 [Mariannaea sp. PMI_226]|nr:hypothetical protein BGZ63DRAFT_71928 [Mariannaea sp. PMI_226]
MQFSDTVLHDYSILYDHDDQSVISLATTEMRFRQHSNGWKVLELSPNLCLLDTYLSSGCQFPQRKERDQRHSGECRVVVSGIASPSCRLLHCTRCIESEYNQLHLPAHAMNAWTSTLPRRAHHQPFTVHPSESPLAETSCRPPCYDTCFRRCTPGRLCRRLCRGASRSGRMADWG